MAKARRSFTNEFKIAAVQLVTGKGFVFADHGRIALKGLRARARTREPPGQTDGQKVALCLRPSRRFPAICAWHAPC